MEFSRTSPEVFIRHYLQDNIHPRKVYVGYDFHFGKDRVGSMRMLTELGPSLGFEVTIIPEVRIADSDVNSTRIRSLLAEGQVGDARRFLGRPYAIRGRVISGDQRGQELGFPTANLDPENEILPYEGVYVGVLRFLEGERADQGGWVGQEYRAVVNVGRRPTFKQGESVLVEAHLLDFEGDIYGHRVELAFVRRLRDEQRFPDRNALQRQIERDIESARSAELVDEREL